MAFRKLAPPTSVAATPDQLLLDLPRRKIPSVLHHQGVMLQAYAKDMVSAADVALQLPTGSGKTLVGLLIGEWRRRKFRERVVYLCPTTQLVNQVVEEADRKYGISAIGFTGKKAEYDPSDKASYKNADKVAVTNYSSLFNTNPFFDDAQIIIIDDAHAAENYIASMWTVRIERFKEEHAALHAAVSAVLKPRLDPLNFERLAGNWDSFADSVWVDKLPTPVLCEMQHELRAALDAHIAFTELKYPWKLIAAHLTSCQFYMSGTEILIRPLIPPTWTHRAFNDAKQRIFMSATLGAGGDLERLTGRKSISRIPVPDGWDKQGIGRRFFVFPELSLKEADATTLKHRLMKEAGRSLVLVPSDADRDEMFESVKSSLGFNTFSAKDIETTKKEFVSTLQAVAVVANRYDGIDFPGEDCRLLFVEGLPRATNLQERFLVSRMGAARLLNERIQTRVLQALGRCTRGLEDYSAVVVGGHDLPSYLVDRERRSSLHPELQAELEFGIEQSKDVSIEEFVENFRIFLDHGEPWEAVNLDILNMRDGLDQAHYKAIAELDSVVGDEIEFQSRLWSTDYEGAFEAARRVLGGLSDNELRGYRALWHYLAGSAAWLAGQSGAEALYASARNQFARAREAAKGIPWLVNLARFDASPSEQDQDATTLMKQIENLEGTLQALGSLHDRNYAKREKEILDGLFDPDLFEAAQVKLGEILGFSAGKIEERATPDPWWIVGDVCFVFEDHAGAAATSVLDTTKARQAASHPVWMKKNVPASANAKILAILVTPVTKAERSAEAHLESVALWPIDEFRDWAKNALSVVREVRRTFGEPGDIVWRASAAEKFAQAKLDAKTLFKDRADRLASVGLKMVG